MSVVETDNGDLITRSLQTPPRDIGAQTVIVSEEFIFSYPARTSRPANLEGRIRKANSKT